MEGRLKNERVSLFALLVLIAFEAGCFYYYGLSRHYNYLSSINDLGHFDQAIWGFLVGQPFLNTDIFNIPINRMGLHFDPVLALFVPLYYIAPTVKWLILAQSLALPLAGLPIYFFALRITQFSSVAFLWACVYLCSPFLLSAASWDFHPVALAVPFIALAYLALVNRKYVLLLISCLFVLLCKEHFGLLVIGFGFLWFYRHRESKRSAILILLGAFHFWFVLKFLMPAFSPSGKHLMISEGLGQLSRYSWLGSSFEEIIKSLISNPVATASHVLINMNGWYYLVLLVLPLFFLPILGSAFLLPGLADIFANLLSMNPMPRSIFAYHSVTLVPVVVASAIYGSQRTRCFFIRGMTRKAVWAALVITLLFSWKSFPFFHLPGGDGFWAPKRVVGFHDENYARVQALIPQHMSLSVQANVGAHFTHREQVFKYPDKVNQVDVVLLRLDSPTTLSSRHDPHAVASLGHHLQMDPQEYLNSINRLLIDDFYPKKIWLDPWLILMKGPETSIESDVIEQKLSKLKNEWQ